MFASNFLDSLPIDRSGSLSPRQVLGAVASTVTPSKVAKPELLAWISEVASLLELPTNPSTEWIEAVAGNRILDGMAPYSACYGGHQFGNWAGQLGDGRAITLCEIRTSANKTYELQLKGAGPTPYSRTADGRAVLRSSLRELVCSEAMFHLGVPTTRALSLVTTGDLVLRDMFYNGNARREPGAITSRVAPSFLRFGNFELPTARGDIELLRKLANYTIANHFWPAPANGFGPADYVQFFYQVALRTAHLMVEWMRVGFVHGVMNTDNMSILGLTIDYGPYGWLEPYDPRWTPNTTDADGRRYCFGAQPRVGQWNVAQLARALRPLIDDDSALAAGIDMFWREYTFGYRKMMLAKLGVEASKDSDDDDLISELLSVFALTEFDYTIFFRSLADVSRSQTTAEQVATLRAACYDEAEFTRNAEPALVEWLTSYCQRIDDNHEARKRAMNQINPIYVPRNYLAQLAIDALTERGDRTPLLELLEVGKSPYTAIAGREKFAEKMPQWARTKAGCSMLSCSS